MPFSLLGRCQVRAARPLAPPAAEPVVFACHLPGVTAPGQRQATGTHANMLVVARSIVTTSKILRLQTPQSLRTLQSVNCAAICVHYLILLPPAARLHLGSTFIQNSIFQLVFFCCCCYWLGGFCCFVSGCSVCRFFKLPYVI